MNSNDYRTGVVVHDGRKYPPKTVRSSQTYDDLMNPPAETVARQPSQDAGLPIGSQFETMDAPAISNNLLNLSGQFQPHLIYRKRLALRGGESGQLRGQAADHTYDDSNVTAFHSGATPAYEVRSEAADNSVPPQLPVRDNATLTHYGDAQQQEPKDSSGMTYNGAYWERDHG